MTMQIRFRLLLIVPLLGCGTQPPLSIEVQRGVPATQLTLRITEADPAHDHPIEMISLNASPAGAQNPASLGAVIWVAAHMNGQPYLRPPVTLKFGASVPGYTWSAVPALVHGGYEARVSAGRVSALTQFRVTERNIVE
jgi:hypothetical protein